MNDMPVNLTDNQKISLEKLAQLRSLSQEVSKLRKEWQDSCTHPEEFHNDPGEYHYHCDLCGQNPNGSRWDDW